MSVIVLYYTYSGGLMTMQINCKIVARAMILRGELWSNGWGGGGRVKSPLMIFFQQLE